jgi:rod shape-determining protein MreC
MKNEQNLKWDVEFYSDFSQLKYVFAEVVSKKENTDTNETTSESSKEDKTLIDPKIKILKDELKIIEMTNFKLAEESWKLKK